MMSNVIARNVAIRVRDGDDHHVERHGRRGDGDGARSGRSSRYGLTPQARSATVSRSAESRPRPTRMPDQQGHRNGQAEGLRDQRPEQAGDRPPADPLGEQVLEMLHERRQRQEEREDQERQEHRRQDFPDDVAVERLGHRIDDSSFQLELPAFGDSRAVAPAGRPQTFHSPVFLGISYGSDNECYVN